MKSSLLLALTLTFASFEGNAAIYEGKGFYGDREIRIYGELNIPHFLTSEAVRVESGSHEVDPFHSDEIAYTCTTSVEFQGATLFFEVEDVKTGEQLLFVDEDAAVLRGSATTYSSEKVKCQAADFSKVPVELTFSAGVPLHLPVAKKDGYEVSLALYPILNNHASLTLEKAGDRYELETAKWESKLKRELEIPFFHWGGVTKQVGSVLLTYLRAE